MRSGHGRSGAPRQREARRYRLSSLSPLSGKIGEIGKIGQKQKPLRTLAISVQICTC